jgi:hypothetical protein
MSFLLTLPNSILSVPHHSHSHSFLSSPPQRVFLVKERGWAQRLSALQDELHTRQRDYLSAHELELAALPFIVGYDASSTSASSSSSASSSTYSSSSSSSSLSSSSSASSSSASSFLSQRDRQRAEAVRNELRAAVAALKAQV